MPAVIKETDNRPFEKVTVDPVTLDLIENALLNARQEMDAVVIRTAMSPGMREQNDAFPMISDRNGKLIVGQFGSFIAGFIDEYAGTVEEGDIFITNDPYSVDGAISHLCDWLVVLPIFSEGRLVSWAAMLGHLTDVGGRVPCSMPYGAKQIFEEGIQIPPVKLMTRGELNQDLLDLLLRNCRLPDWNRTDLFSLVAAVRTAERHVHDLIGRFGCDTFVSACDQMLARNREAMRKIIQRVVPEQKLYFEDYIDSDGGGGGPYRMACSMWREGEKVIFDFEGTAPQSEYSVNLLLSRPIFKLFFGMLTVKLFDPEIVCNEGFADLVEVRIPEGTILRPLRPAALSNRGHVVGRMFDVLHGLLGQAVPEALCGAGFSDSPHFMYFGHDQRGEWFQLYQIGFGGLPARPFGDGFDGHALWPGFKSVPNEFLETYYPLRVEAYETLPDTGGAGFFRGGNGLRVVYHLLEEGEISIHDDRWLTYPWGVKGGKPGARGSKLLVRASGGEEWLPAKCDGVKVMPGDQLIFDTWGAGGWGDPLDRDPGKVALEVRQGLVTREGAASYGVVLTDDLSVDAAATESMRAELRQARGPIDLFDRGGTIPEILARCQAETHLEPPVPPTPYGGMVGEAAQ